MWPAASSATIFPSAPAIRGSGGSIIPSVGDGVLRLAAAAGGLCAWANAHNRTVLLIILFPRRHDLGFWAIAMDMGGTYASTSAGWMNTWANVGGVISPIVFGALVTNGKLDPAVSGGERAYADRRRRGLADRHRHEAFRSDRQTPRPWRNKIIGPMESGSRPAIWLSQEVWRAQTARPRRRCR